MTARPSPPDDPANLEQIAHLRHELLTPINHILGLTELQMDEAPETGLADYVPALAEINTRGRKLLAIIEGELAAFSCPSDLRQLEARLESEARLTLGQARKLAEQFHAIGQHSAAEEVNLVTRALESLIAISRETAHHLLAGSPAEQIRK
jgi:signal transduction histidine kinase